MGRDVQSRINCCFCHKRQRMQPSCIGVKLGIRQMFRIYFICFIHTDIRVQPDRFSRRHKNEKILDIKLNWLEEKLILA